MAESLKSEGKRKVNKKIKTATLLFLIFSALTTIVYAGIKTLQTIETSGAITHAMIETTPSTIEWGNMTVGDPNIKELALTNTGNLTIELLHIDYELPIDFTGSLSWDLEGESLDIGQTKVALLNLTVTDAPEVPFAFNITITGDV